VAVERPGRLGEPKPLPAVGGHGRRRGVGGQDPVAPGLQVRRTAPQHQLLSHITPLGFGDRRLQTPPKVLPSPAWTLNPPDMQYF